MKRALHPSGRELLFDSKAHSYTMKDVGMFTSVTAVLGKYFPFDKFETAKSISKTTGQTIDEVQQEWKWAAQLGTNTHSYLEARALGNKVPIIPPELAQGSEPFFFDAADALLESVLREYEPIAIEPLICCPDACVAGMVDFIGRNKQTGKCVVLDWKTSRRYFSSGPTEFDTRVGTRPPVAFKPVVPENLWERKQNAVLPSSPSSSEISGTTINSALDSAVARPYPDSRYFTHTVNHLTDQKLYTYALQVFLYGRILRREGYVRQLGLPKHEGDWEYKLAVLCPTEDDPAGHECCKICPNCCPIREKLVQLGRENDGRSPLIKSVTARLISIDRRTILSSLEGIQDGIPPDMILDRILGLRPEDE